MLDLKLAFDMPDKIHLNNKTYMRLLVIALVNGVLVSGIAFVVQGWNFGYENVTIQAITPALIFGTIVSFIIAYLIVKNQKIFLERLSIERDISSKLRAEIAERTRVDLALKESEQSYRRILDNMQDTYYRVDLEGRIGMASPAASRLLGYDVEELIGTKLVDLYVDPKRREVFLRRLEADGGKAEQFEVALRRKGGEEVLVSSNAHYWRNGDGDIAGIEGTVRDITASKRAEEAVRIRDAWLRAILENTLTEIILKDTEGHFLTVSRNVADVHGLQREDFIGRTSADFLPADIADANLLADRRVVETGEPMQREVTEEINGVIRYLLNAKFPLRDKDGKITGVCSMTSDITEMKQAEEQLRQAQKMEAVGQLTGGVAHDFNNMLAAIIGNLDLIETGSITDEFDRESIATALRAALSGAELTHRLLAFSRKQELNAKATDINQMLPQFGQLAQRTIGADIAIKLTLAAGLWPTMVDAGQLENALLNLAINVRDAMPDGGQLTIQTANWTLGEDDSPAYEDLAPGAYVMIAVSDNGTGMPATVRERAFEPFFTTKDVGDGSGLGLSMVFGFAKQSGGHVSLHSNDGAGTTVRIYLPRAGAATTAEPTIKPSKNDRPTGTETIFVVEDDKAVRDYLVTVLGRLGYVVMEAEDGPAALEIISAAGTIDLLLTDVILPRGMSGRDVAMAFRERYPAAGVVYSSGYTREILNRRGQLEEGVVLLNKPYQTQALAQRVREVLDGRQFFP